jgi:hypothetical protein
MKEQYASIWGSMARQRLQDGEYSSNMFMFVGERIKGASKPIVMVMSKKPSLIQS